MSRYLLETLLPGLHPLAVPVTGLVKYFQIFSNISLSPGAAPDAEMTSLGINQSGPGVSCIQIQTGIFRLKEKTLTFGNKIKKISFCLLLNYYKYHHYTGY